MTQTATTTWFYVKCRYLLTGDEYFLGRNWMYTARSKTYRGKGNGKHLVRFETKEGAAEAAERLNADPDEKNVAAQDRRTFFVAE